MNGRFTQATLLAGGHGAAFLQTLSTFLQDDDGVFLSQFLFWIAALASIGALCAFHELGAVFDGGSRKGPWMSISLICMAAIMLNVLGVIASAVGLFEPLNMILDDLPCLNCS